MIWAILIGLGVACLVAEPGGWGWVIGFAGAAVIPPLLDWYGRRLCRRVEAEWEQVLELTAANQKLDAEIRRAKEDIRRRKDAR